MAEIEALRKAVHAQKVLLDEQEKLLVATEAKYKRTLRWITALSGLFSHLQEGQFNVFKSAIRSLEIMLITPDDVMETYKEVLRGDEL